MAESPKTYTTLGYLRLHEFLFHPCIRNYTHGRKAFANPEGFVMWWMWGWWFPALAMFLF